MKHVFLSYSRKDSAYAELLEEELTERDHTVWRDQSSIQGGADWEGEITNALSEAYAVLVINSRSSEESEWVKFEIEYANRIREKIQIIPLSLDDSKIPPSLNKMQAIEFAFLSELRDISQIRQYKRSLRSLLDALESSRPILRYLRELKSANEQVREKAAHEIGNLRDPIATDPLIDALSDLDVDVKFEAATALGKLKSKTALKQLIRILDEGDPDVCAAAATALGEIAMPEALGPLVKRLGHEDRFVRASSAIALGKLKEKSAVEPLIRLMRNDGISDVREAAAVALCNLDSKRAERAMKRIGLDAEAIRKKNRVGIAKPISKYVVVVDSGGA